MNRGSICSAARTLVVSGSLGRVRKLESPRDAKAALKKDEITGVELGANRGATPRRRLC
jgi:hypothetical protein